MGSEMKFFKILLSTLCVAMLSSCGTHMVVSSRGCNGKISWASTQNCDKQFDFHFNKKIFTTFGFWKTRYIELNKLFKEEGFECSEVDSIQVSFANTDSDLLWNLIPVYSQKTIIVSGTFKNSKSMEEYLDVKEDI